MLVGIDGRGGAGKSTYARELAAQLGDSVVIEFDDFYRPSATRLPPGDPDIGGNFEWRRLRRRCCSRSHAARRRAPALRLGQRLDGRVGATFPPAASWW